MSSVFSDDFNRADSDTTGNGWSEISLEAGDVGILNNRLSCPSTEDGTYLQNAGALAHRSISTWGADDITVEFVFRLDSASENTTSINGVSVRHDGSARGHARGVYMDISVGNDDITVMDRDGTSTPVEKGSSSFTMTTDTDYYIRWDIESDNSMRVYANTAGFGSMTPSDLLFTVSAFTPASSDTRLGLGDRFYAQYDSVELFSPVKAEAEEAATDNAIFSFGGM